MISHSRLVDLTSDNYPSLHHKFEAKLIKKYVKNKRILDIGCWTGQFLSQVESIANCSGVDPDKKAIKFARLNRKGNYQVGSALKLPFKNNTFDVVTMWDVIEHIPVNTEQRAIKEVARVLKKNGVFALSTMTNHPISILFDPAYFLLGHRHYSFAQLKMWLDSNGLIIEKNIYSGGIWTILRENINLFTKHILKSGSNDKLFESKVEKEFSGTGFLEFHIFARKLN